MIEINYRAGASDMGDNGEDSSIFGALLTKVNFIAGVSGGLCLRSIACRQISSRELKP